jgi:hypothetical protein
MSEKFVQTIRLLCRLSRKDNLCTLSPDFFSRLFQNMYDEHGVALCCKDDKVFHTNKD